MLESDINVDYIVNIHGVVAPQTNNYVFASWKMASHSVMIL